MGTFLKRKALKRPHNLDKIDRSQHLKRVRNATNKRDKSSSTSSSGRSYERSSESDISEELEVYKESSMYDNLLSVLGHCCESLPELYETQRDRLEGEGGSAESSRLSEGESDGNSVEVSGDQGNEVRKLIEHDLDGHEGESEEDKSGNDDSTEYSASDSGENDQFNADESRITSSFHAHVGRILTEAEVRDLTERKWKFDWEMPADNVSTGKWVGTGESLFKELGLGSTYGLKPKLYEHWLDVYKTSGGSDFHSSKQRQFFSLCNSYRDIMHCNKKPFYLKGLEEDTSIMDAYIMHMLNHFFHTRDVVKKNDAKLAKHPENGKDELLSGDGFLDQGFTRPKVLILLPLRSIALRVVTRLIQLAPLSHRANVEHLDRFITEFGVEEDEDGSSEILKSLKTLKPADHEALFSGNNDDHFMLGIKFTKGNIKLFSDFYSSDLIVASPFALITKMGEAKVEKEKDVDYLSSIEILIIDHADVVGMQNWSHLDTVVEQLNHIPIKQHGTDIMRIRNWYLDGNAKFYRQTILLGFFPNPEMNALFNQRCVNYHGKMKLVSEYKGVLHKVLFQVRQAYERFDAASVTGADDARFDFFAKKVFPKIKDSIQGGVLLFISSYFEFVRLRNFLKAQNTSFCSLMDHTKQSDISRARSNFFHGKQKIMLYTERAYFYYRYKIRGVKNLIIYSLPERKEFYPEILNMVEDSTDMSCTVLFTPFDKFRLERIVGTPATKRMLSSNKDMFVFC
ncbi:protein NUCLEOLAR FACTOR 1-like [Aristolochia californica]|uniref:protein NUCLEOLAR FACTOR 1-like n=1 Tax=Aristolochia californica TaxID=171875 RepID=UPI0035DACCA7